MKAESIPIKILNKEIYNLHIFKTDNYANSSKSKTVANNAIKMDPS